VLRGNVLSGSPWDRDLRPTFVRVCLEGADNRGLRKLVLSGNRIGGVIAFARALRNVMTRSEGPLEVRRSWKLCSLADRITIGIPVVGLRTVASWVL